MGHSLGFQDAQWLGRKILEWVLSGKELQEIAHFELVGSRLAVAMLREPLGGGKSVLGLSLTFSTADGKDPGLGSLDAPSALRAMLHEDRILRVSQSLRSRFDRPQTVRRVMRTLLRQARELKTEEPCPWPAQNQILLVSRETSEEEITLQLVVVLSRWGFLELNEDDRNAFIKYLCNLQRSPKTFAYAAEEAVSLLLTNWVLPQDWEDFKRYAKQTLWAFYAKGARAPATGRPSPGNARRTTEAWAELANERKRRGTGRRSLGSGEVSVTELARSSYTDPRRIYEAIKAGKIKAVKAGQSLCIERKSADEFMLQARQRQEIILLRKRLSSMGVNKDALRKQLYRLRRAGASDTKIIEHLTLKISRLSSKKRARSSG
jgi:hypothetical protein